MNYQRIYKQFISDRRYRDFAEGEYFETHHIDPKSMGGSNEKENLIRLTPEDHFFAHLLLAKMYNKQGLWAVIMMYTNRKHGLYIGRKDRNKYGWLRRIYAKKVSETFSGENHPNYDHTIYEFKNVDGRTEKCTGYELRDKYNLGQQNLWNVLKGKRSAVKGWVLSGTNIEDLGYQTGANHCNADTNEYIFYHHSGMIFKGNRYDFHDKHNVPHHAISKLVIGESTRTSDGWALNPDDTSHTPTPRDTTIYSFTNEEGETIESTKLEFSIETGIPLTQVVAVANGQRASTAGWRLVTTPKDLVGLPTGERHHNYNKTKHLFVHKDGAKEECTQYELCTKYNIDVRNVSAMIHGKKKSAYGWRLAEKK